MFEGLFKGRPARVRRGVVFRGTTAMGVCLIASTAVAQDLTWNLPGDGAWTIEVATDDRPSQFVSGAFRAAAWSVALLSQGA